MYNSKFKTLECLFAWLEFYSNSKALEVNTQFNQIMFNKTKKQIQNLRKQLID